MEAEILAAILIIFIWLDIGHICLGQAVILFPISIVEPFHLRSKSMLDALQSEAVLCNNVLHSDQEVGHQSIIVSATTYAFIDSYRSFFYR